MAVKEAAEAGKRAKKETEKESRIIASLKQIENVCEELKAGKVSTKEALDKLKDISDKMPE
ncbi:MAG: hypothetical protein E3J93_02405 [Dehalococcoidia bacterium]|nr:MAG: hypothetical protein E3J93_02405 [Dehalococcoidia bacterium]